MQMIIISGLSGAGKSKAGEFLEDAGFYTIDNMPAALMTRFAELCLDGGNSRYQKVAMVSDIRGGKNFDDLFTALDDMKAMGIDCKLLFLEASTPAIIQRYKETRRNHPLAVGEISLSQAVEREKELLIPVRERADYIINSTTFRTNAKLRSVLLQMFGDGDRRQLQVSVQSFGYKYGLPLEADLVLDVRFLPNPFYKAELRQHNGLEEPVRDYLFQYEETATFLRKLEDLLRFLLPLYEEEGKSSLVIAVGCTGGQHRSVAMAHAIVQQIQAIGYPVTESHRDMTRERK
ncbi:MAG: RNase adapter RapZ [Candidatus Onthomonas sp.]|nr:RNase adapter RapZ [Candidatus Onthomonas sp.]